VRRLQDYTTHRLDSEDLVCQSILHSICIYYEPIFEGSLIIKILDQVSVQLNKSLRPKRN
jgi:hypothetical protein